MTLGIKKKIKSALSDGKPSKVSILVSIQVHIQTPTCHSSRAVPVVFGEIEACCYTFYTVALPVYNLM